MAPGYLTDPFVLNNSVYDCHTCNCTNIPVKKYNLSLGQCKLAYKFGKLWDTIPVCIQNACSAEIITTVSHDVHTCKHFMIYIWLRDCLHLAGRLFRLINIYVVVVVVVIVRTLSPTIRYLLLLLLLLLCRSG